MAAEENVEELIRNISDIVYNTTNIAYLSKAITSGNIYRGHGFRSNLRSSDSIIPNSSWIRVCRLNKVFLSKYIEWKNENYFSTRSTKKTLGFIKLYNSSYYSKSSDRDGQISSMYLGVNVDRNIKLNGYSFNASDIYNSFIVENNIDGYKSQQCENRMSISFFIHKLLFIGEKNFLVGMIDKDGILYIDHVILNKILNKSQDEFKDLIKKIFSVYANVNSLFFKFNIVGLGEDISQSIQRYLYANINESTKNCTIIEPIHIDIFSQNNTINEFINRIKDAIQEEINKYLDGNYWGSNNQYSFSQIIDEILSSKESQHRADIEESFFRGLLYANKFELSGWNISEKRFNDEKELVWEKEVNIVPSRVVRNKKLYNINNNDPDWKNPFKIKMIYVTCNGRMYAEGKHPNVSCQKVCMGDISGKISFSDPKKLGENLNKCEALLTLINYDSAYDSSMCKEILEHSTLDISSKIELDGEYVGDGEQLTDVCYEDDSETEENNNDIVEETDDTNIEIINEEP